MTSTLRCPSSHYYKWCIFGGYCGSLLGCRVIELVLAGTGEAALDAAVGPQPVDDVGQVLRQDPLLLCSR